MPNAGDKKQTKVDLVEDVDATQDDTKKNKSIKLHNAGPTKQNKAAFVDSGVNETQYKKTNNTYIKLPTPGPTKQNGLELPKSLTFNRTYKQLHNNLKRRHVFTGVDTPEKLTVHQKIKRKIDLQKVYEHTL